MSASQILSRSEWQRMTDGAPMALTVSKVKQGIVQRMYLHGELIQETFSKRPYRLGQACDGTIDRCVYGLLILFCRTRQIDLEQLLVQTYADQEPFTVCEQGAVLQEAIAQGIVIPEQWDSKAFAGLLDSLAEINNHLLVDHLDSAIFGIL